MQAKIEQNSIAFISYDRLVGTNTDSWKIVQRGTPQAERVNVCQVLKNGYRPIEDPTYVYISVIRTLYSNTVLFSMLKY